ncbi:unnamed protein product [Rangifer tarandus platyrhynchus]|uniref:Uncharacterized protein n=1 Tax=Rangifer tarandus platyrhynchus TaxID=3082113 RepID=A0AC59ZVM0_RANTA
MQPAPCLSWFRKTGVEEVVLPCGANRPPPPQDADMADHSTSLRWESGRSGPGSPASSLSSGAASVGENPWGR